MFIVINFQKYCKQCVEYFAPIEKFGIDLKLEQAFVYCPNSFLIC